MMSDLDLPNKGPKDYLLLMFPEVMVPFIIPAFSSLIGQLEATTTLIVVTHATSASQIKSCLDQAKLNNNCHMIIADDDTPLNMWIQDHILMGTDENNNHQILIAKQAEQTFYDVIARVATAAKLPLLSFDGDKLPDGGNIVFDGQNLFLGRDEGHKGIPAAVFNGIHKDNVYQIGSRLTVPTERKVAIKLAEQDWHVIINIGNKQNTVQPIFHIDLFIAMAGRRTGTDSKQQARVLVGDPSIASEILGIEYAELAMQEHFDDIALQLKESGFEVIRNPLPLVFCDDIKKQERTWYFASGNNVIIKNNGDKRIVWLPTYGHGNWPELEATDKINAKTWEDLGYDVRLIEGCQPLAENFGGLHCFSKTWG